MDNFFGFSELLDYGLYLRGIIITLFAIILFRASSTRLYGNHSPLDFIIYIIIGAILGKAIVEHLPLLPSMIVCTFIVIIHNFLSYLCFKSHWLGKYIKGENVCLVKNGRYIRENLKCCRLTSHDILQSLRIQHSMKKISSVEEALLERNGQISFILKK